MLLCTLMGDLQRGMFDKIGQLARKTFHVPLCGFAESFNLSFATSITLPYMSAASGRGYRQDGNENAMKGPLCVWEIWINMKHDA